MTLIERIQKDLTEAMKGKNELRLSVLRMVKTALKNKEIEKIRALEEADVLARVQKDLADKETKEIPIIEGYLPAAPTDAELTQAIEAAIAETGANSPKQMGTVIKAARAKLEGKRGDGKVLRDKVK